jgi:two-component system sensor histidine kinase BarA
MPHTRILAWFAVSSLVVFLLIGVGISHFRARDVNEREERAAASRAELVAHQAIAPLLTATDVAAPVTGSRYDTFEQRVASVQQAQPSIVRIKIWSIEGQVLFSNDRDQVGTRPDVEEELEEALDGELANEISDLSAGENSSERLLADKLFETYVPFRFTGDDKVAAVIEVYQDYSVIQSEVDRLTRTLSISLAIGLLALYVVMLPLMVGITRTLRRQNQKLQEQHDQLSELLEREQGTVAELRELDRLKSDFVAATSHELRTPLTSIRGYVHILRQSALAGDPTAVEALGAIERQSSRLFRLIANVLRESNLEHDDAVNAVFMFPFGDLVDEVIADFHDTGKRIVNELPDDLAPVTVDRRRIQDVVVNLIDNALKYSSTPTHVTVGAQVDASTLTFWVGDEGIGIAAEDLPRIFERFYQADQTATRSHGGVGLGLHIVSGLVETMGGRVDVRSTTGAGSTFTVTVPLASVEDLPATDPVDAARV